MTILAGIENRFTMRAGRFVFLAAFALVCFADRGLAQPIIAESHFDADAEGWTAMRTVNLSPLDPTPVPSGNLAWVETGGNLGGYFQHVDPNDGRTSYWQAPSGFLGDRSAAYGGVLSFDLKQSSTGSQYDIADVVIQGAGMTLAANTSYNPRVSWTRYHVLLAAGGGWHVDTLSGPAATPAEVQQALAALTALYIRAEYRSGNDTDGLDNVVLTGPSPNCPASTFDADDEGWWTLRDTNLPAWAKLTGNPDGCFTVSDLADGVEWRYLAPAKFLGDRSAFVGTIFEFDLRATPVAEPDPAEGLRMVNVTGSELTLQFAAESNPADNGWTHFAVPLQPSPQWSRTSDGQVPTMQDFADVFGALSELSIRGEFYSGVDEGSLDNVVFLDCRPCLPAADFDQSGQVDALDIPTMVDVLLGVDINPWHLLCADVNLDGYANGADLGGFIEAILIP